MAVYTPLDYVVGLAILFLIMWLASRQLFPRIPLDIYFAYAMTPVMVFAISVRVLADAGVFPKNDYLSVTPGIYITATLFGLAVLLGGKLIERIKNIPYWKGAIALGTPFAAYFTILLFQEMRSPFNMIQPMVLALILTITIYLVSNLNQLTRIFRGRINTAIIYGHMLDGSATFIGIDKYGFSEEHILPELLINAAGTAFVMIPLKIVVVLGALYLLDKWKEEEEGSDLYYKMIKFVFFIFGFGPGMRDSLLLTL